MPFKSSNRIEVARNFAMERHGDQLWGDQPYVTHLDLVANAANVFISQGSVVPSLYQVRPFYREHIGVVSYLHDILEDTSTTYDEVCEKFGTAAAEDVESLTDADGANRKERKLKTWHKLRRNPIVTFVKCCDRFVNTSGSKREMYRKEFPSFQSALYVPNQMDYVWKMLHERTYGDG